MQYTPYGVDLLNTNVGYAVGSPQSGDNFVLKTTDGPKWRPSSSVIAGSGGTLLGFSSVSC